MKYRFHVLLALFLTLSLSALGQKAQQAAVAEQNLRKHVEYLASDQLEGRRSGEAGATSAAGYVANQFAQVRLKPAVKGAKGKGNFLQLFPYVSGVSVGDSSSLRLIPSDSTRENKLEAGIAYLPFGNSINGDVPTAPLVFAGYGIVTPDKKYDDYSALDVSGKIVLVFNGAPEGGSRETFGQFNIHAKANLAKEHGAKALIVIARSDDFKTDPLSRLVYEPTTGETAIPVVAIDRSIAAGFLGARDMRELAEIEKWLAMKTNAPPSIQIKLANPPQAAAQLKVDLQKKTVDAYNVIGIIEGNDATLKSEAIIIGAHYDHLGYGGPGSLAANSTEIHHGADDNASGTAAILELARQFAKEKKNKRTLIFMAFGGEEEGLLGSKYHVNNPVWPLDKTVAMINMDMVGRLNENRLTVGGIGTASEWKTLVTNRNGFEVRLTVGEQNIAVKSEIEKKLHNAKIPYVRVEVTDSIVRLGGVVNKKKLAEAVQIAAEMKRVKIENGIYAVDGEPSREEADASIPFSLQLNEDGFGPSDHSSFYGKQIPVLFFFTGTHLDYHKPSDTAEKINYKGLSKITSYVAAIAKSVDENPTRPTYKVAQSSGMGGRAQFNVSLGTIPAYAETNDGLGLDGVRDGSPAAKSGLKAGDKIIKLAGKDVRNISDYMFALGVMKPGEEYEVVVKRGTETLVLKIVPAPAARR